MFKIIQKIIIISAILAPASVFALTIGPISGGTLTFDIKPENPGTFTDVAVKATTYGADIDRSQVSWFVNGKLIKDGMGEKTFTFRTGKAGEGIFVDAMVKTLDGREIQRSFSLNLGDIDLIWEADTQTPPFYKGKALVTPGSKIKVTAVPNLVTTNGVKLSVNDLVYKWKFRDKSLGGGYGKNSVSIEAGIPILDNLISVQVSNLQGDINVEKSMIIKPVSTKLIIYEDTPLEGTFWARGFTGNINLNSIESSLRAESYFVSKDSTTSFNWTLNGKPFSPDTKNQRVATLRNESGGEITSEIGLSISNSKNSYQNASKKFLIKSLSGFFGI